VAGGDTTNSLKQAAEFGLTGKQSMVVAHLHAEQRASAGLEGLAGRAHGEPVLLGHERPDARLLARFQKRAHNGAMPNDMQAGVYSAVLHFLKAVDKVGGAADGKAVVAAMKAMPTDDPLFGKGRIREDGRKLHPMYLLQVKSPEEFEGRLGLLQGDLDHPGRAGFPADERG